MSVNIPKVKCPKCDKGVMVPLSGYVYEGVTKKAVPLAKWKCTNCDYTIDAEL